MSKRKRGMPRVEMVESVASCIEDLSFGMTPEVYFDFLEEIEAEISMMKDAARDDIRDAVKVLRHARGVEP